ncbi:Forkhead box protein J1.2 [Halotydeus destructor]|nr:Forkhead box protein J1.2 [Halotydeus destructor]
MSVESSAQCHGSQVYLPLQPPPPDTWGPVFDHQDHYHDRGGGLHLPPMVAANGQLQYQVQYDYATGQPLPPAPTTVDDGLTSLSWLQNLNMSMTRLGVPTPPTPPDSLNCSLDETGNSGQYSQASDHQGRPSSATSVNVLKASLSANKTSPLSLSSCPSSQVSVSSSSYSSAANATSVSSSRPKSTGNGGHKEAKMTKKAALQAAALEAAREAQAVDYRAEGSSKPPFSYATLICMAMKANCNKMTLNSIYKWIRDNFLYYQNADPSWQVEERGGDSRA